MLVTSYGRPVIDRRKEPEERKTIPYVIFRKPTEHPITAGMKLIIQHWYTITIAVKRIEEPNFSYGMENILISEIYRYIENKNARN